MKIKFNIVVLLVILIPAFIASKGKSNSGKKPSAQTLDSSDLNVPVTVIEKFDQEPDTARKLDFPPK
jgi:hypothetical protein